MFGLIGCDSKKNIPSLAEVSQMNYEEANKALSGQDIQKIREAWGEPIDSDDKEAMWQVDSSMIIEITHSNSGVVESCELLCGTPLAPMDE